MKKLFTILSLSLLLHAQDKIILTKPQLICLNQTIDRYIEESKEVDPVVVILENSCEKEKIKKLTFSSHTKGLPDLSTIPINPASGISEDEIKVFTKEELMCLKTTLPKYLDQTSEKIEVMLKCHE